MKKWTQKYIDEIKPGEKCPCHGLLVFDGSDDMADTVPVGSVCPDGLFDYLFQVNWAYAPNRLMERMLLSLIRR